MMEQDKVLAQAPAAMNRQRPPRPRETAAPVLAQLMALKRMSVGEMKARWEALFAAPAPNNSRGYLELRIGWRLQELTHGGPSRETRRTLDLLADEVEGKIGRRTMLSDSRNPVIGTRLVREWAGVEHTVTVARDGYEFEGRRYKSLSAIARAITGTQWNGWRFFGIRATAGDRR
jgi:hypothetical protein